MKTSSLVLTQGNGRLLLANEAGGDAGEQEFCVFANQQTADAQGWVQLAPYGDFPNTDERGHAVIQRFTRAEAQEIVNEFHALLNLPQRLLGLPWYVGHPDHPRFRGQPGHTDTAAKGRIKDLEAREDGLYGRVKFNSAGRQLIEDEAFHGHSVNWHAAAAGTEGGKTIFAPRGLKSVGFTNQPQIPVTPVSLPNEQAPFLVTLDEQGGLTVALVKEEDAATVRTLVEECATAKAALASERAARAGLVIEPLVRSGRIKTSEREAKLAELANAGECFDAVAASFAMAGPLVKTVAKTAGLGRQNVELQSDVRARQTRFEALLSGREQEFPNEDYHARFEAVSASAEGRQLFSQMKRAGAEE